MDTIFALATAPGKAGVAVIRLSGTQALPLLQQLTGKPQWTPAHLRLVHFTSPDSGQRLDEGMAVWFPAGRSYTGEDVAELHLHGSSAVINAMYRVLGKQSGVRLAEAGEFTRRRLLNGLCGLLETEALADLLEAETEEQHRQALRQYSGETSALYETWRQELLEARALLEASMDFTDEEIPAGLQEQVYTAVQHIARTVKGYLGDNHRGEMIRHGIPVAIIGAPNAGKSTLLNTLAKRDVAITTPHAGTTRDVLEIRLNIGGYPVIIADTAGLRDATDPVERIGIDRARAWVSRAAIVLLLDTPDTPAPLAINDPLLNGKTVIPVRSKQDIFSGTPLPTGHLALSAHSGQGISTLLETIGGYIRAQYNTPSSPVITQERHRQCLEHFAAALESALHESREELIAEQLRHADLWLGKLAGRIDTEEILGAIFSQFCIGK